MSVEEAKTPLEGKTDRSNSRYKVASGGESEASLQNSKRTGREQEQHVTQ